MEFEQRKGHHGIISTRREQAIRAFHRYLVHHWEKTYSLCTVEAVHWSVLTLSTAGQAEDLDPARFPETACQYVSAVYHDVRRTV